MGLAAGVALWAFSGCSQPAPAQEGRSVESIVAQAAVSVSSAPADADGDACRSRAAQILAEPGLPGAPEFDAHRVEILGRARGEPLVLLREPSPTPIEELSPAWAASRRVFDGGRPGSRVVQLVRRHPRDPAALRALLLRQGYLYSADPLDALALSTRLTLTDLFQEPEIWLQRGADTRRLVRTVRRRETHYHYADGPLQGLRADLLFGDRLALREEDLGAPLHRDLAALADSVGFDRARIVHRTEAALLADLRFGDRWVRGILDARGAALTFGCMAEDRATRDAVAQWTAEDAPRRRAMHEVQRTVTEQVKETLRFDRPEGEKSPDRDGQLRPAWISAYLSGRGSFDFDGESYPVFDPDGNPSPPQVCVDFVLDTFERASGTWFLPRGGPLRRQKGRLDFNDIDIPNRRAVIAFGKFADSRPDLFEVRWFTGDERIPFRDRSRFFTFLSDHADLVRPGDVMAIHGLKADERIHQHAIFVERTDPVTGFPHGLADQMKRPRRRTWEGIMAEAPLRSLFYRIRPLPSVFARVDPGDRTPQK
jgi:hypothetical protein